MNEVYLGCLDRPFGYHRICHKRPERLPERSTHSDDGKRFQLSRLNESYDLKSFVKRPKAARHDDKAHGILDQHQLAHKKMFELDKVVKVCIGFLLFRQSDVAPETEAARLLCATIHGFHHSGPTPRHYRVSLFCQALTE